MNAKTHKKQSNCISLEQQLPCKSTDEDEKMIINLSIKTEMIEKHITRKMVYKAWFNPNIQNIITKLTIILTIDSAKSSRNHKVATSFIVQKRYQKVSSRLMNFFIIVLITCFKWEVKDTEHAG